MEDLRDAATSEHQHITALLAGGLPLSSSPKVGIMNTQTMGKELEKEFCLLHKHAHVHIHIHIHTHSHTHTNTHTHNFRTTCQVC
jgi:hypothetical protein